MKTTQLDNFNKKPRPDPDQAPVFIIGSGRSGTTLLRTMLNAHPNIYITNEASFYLGSQFVPQRASTSDWLETYFRSVFFSWLNIDADLIRRELRAFHALPVPRPHMADGYRAIMRGCARKYNKNRYGDKTPLHSHYLAAIFRDFIGARVVQIMRDPRATICSLSRMPWTPASIYLICHYYQRQLQAVEKYSERILVIRLEDLLDTPEKTLRTVLNFIDEQWDDVVLDYPRYAPNGDLPSFPWLSDAIKPIRKISSDWRQVLPPVWIHFIQRKFKQAFIRYGYEPIMVEPEPIFTETLRTIISELPEAIAFGGRFFQLIRNLSGRYPADPKKIEALLLTQDIRSLQRFPELYSEIIDKGHKWNRTRFP